MTVPSDSGHGESGFRFFGKIAASLSHDLNNVLATINELGGLLDDLIRSVESGRELDPAKLRRALDRIPKQIKRGETYVKQLNNFAHSVDHPCIAMDLTETLQVVLDLSERFARLGKVSLESVFPAEGFTMTGSPFHIQHLGYRAVEAALDVAEAGATITVGYEVVGAEARVDVRCGSPVTATDELTSRLGRLEALSEAMGARVVRRPEQGQPFELALLLPAVGPAQEPSRGGQR